MAEKSAQSYTNHRMLVPGYHYLTVGLLGILLLSSVIRLFVAFSLEAVFQLLLVIAVALVAWYARIFALRAQDRIIRLEMRLRLANLLPADLAARVPELSTGQLIALRFASDEDLPELARRCLGGELRRREDIKRQIRTWEPDHQRL